MRTLGLRGDRKIMRAGLLMALLVGSTCAARSQKPRLDKPRVDKVENGGLLFTDNQAGVSGTDAGYSIPLPHQTLWLFGDVFLLDPQSVNRPYIGAVSNCGLLVSKGMGTTPLRRYTFLADPKTGRTRQLLSPDANDAVNSRFWPFGGWYNPADRRIYLFYSQVRSTGNGPLDFHIDGHGLARAETEGQNAYSFVRLPATSTRKLWWTEDDNAPLFGSAVIADAKDDYIYLVGVQERGRQKMGKLARLPKNRITEFNACEYYSGGGTPPVWSRDLANAADVDGLTDFPNELSIAYNAYLGGYLAVQSVGLSEKVRLSLAPHPWGPYMQIAEISAPHRALTPAFCYAGKEHPELAEERGRIVYITYVDSSRYWLQLLKVTLHR